MAAQVVQKVYEAADLPYSAVSSEEFLSGNLTKEIRKRIRDVIACEAPVCEWLLIKRVINSFGIYKAGSQIRPEMEAVLAGMKLNIQNDDTGRVYWHMGENPKKYAEYRIGGKYDITCRDVQYIPDAEIANAMISVLQEGSMEYADLAKKTALLLGYTRMGTNVRAGMKRGEAYAVREKKIRKKSGTYSI